MEAKDILLDEVIDYIRYKTECGERTAELDSATVTALWNAARGIPTQSSASPVTASPVPRTQVPAPVSRPTAPTQPPAPTEASPRIQASPPTGQNLSEIASACASCNACGLCAQRKQVVPGQGNANQPDIMFIGEAPGADEDEQGLAFVGRAGQLLTKMIAAMGYTREEVFIANICKCRPPNNRTPTFEEMAACIPFLKRQIAIVHPKVIVALGNTALLGLLGTPGIMRLHGQWKKFEGIPLMPTYHPAYLLRLPAAKRDCWNDLKLVMKHLGKTPVAPR